MSDLISRADALKEIEANIKANEKCASDEWLAGQYYAMAAINRLSSVEPKKGKWIKTSVADDGYDINYRCSCCKGNDVKYPWKYCPNCGAEMEWVSAINQKSDGL